MRSNFEQNLPWFFSKEINKSSFNHHKYTQSGDSSLYVLVRLVDQQIYY